MNKNPYPQPAIKPEEYGLKLRRDDLQARFPGVLDSIVAAATQTESREDRDITISSAPAIGAPQAANSPPGSNAEARGSIYPVG
jgi:hypothetical protein